MGALICLKWRRIGREVWSQSQWALCARAEGMGGQGQQQLLIKYLLCWSQMARFHRGQDWSLTLLETDGLEGPRTEQRKKPCTVKGLTVQCVPGHREP